MDKAEANRKKLAEIEAQKEQARKEFEVERAKREAAAKQSAPWQDESWSADADADDDESIGEEVQMELNYLVTDLLFGVATLPEGMAAASEDIVKMLRQRRMIASGKVIDGLASHVNPAELLNLAPKVNFDKDFLPKKYLQKLIELYDQSKPKRILLSQLRQRLTIQQPT